MHNLDPVDSLLTQLPASTQLAINAAEKVGLLCPPKALLFRALELHPKEVKVVILGQDPYHTPGKASGLAFGYHPEYIGAIDSSLANILQEVRRDIGHVGVDKTLQPWVTEGVLLLNTRLSTIQGRPMAHADLGWESFIINQLKRLDERQKNKVYMLWGREAQAFEKYLDGDHNLILKTSHPCKFSVHRGFAGCGHFSKANEYLGSQGRETVKW